MPKVIKKFYFSSLSICNEDCLFCVKGGKSSFNKDLNTEEAKKAIKKAYEREYQELHFDGGEPTIRKDLSLLINFAADVGYQKICILTNALLLSDKKNLVKILKASPKLKPSFSISLHSHKKETSEYLVNTKNTFKRTVKGIQNALESKADVSLYHIITEQNYRDMPDFVRFVSRHFPLIKRIVFSFIYPAGAVLKHKHVIPRLSSVESYFLKALNLCKEKKIPFSISSCGMVPLCFFKGYEQYFIKQQYMDQPSNVKLINKREKKGYQLATKSFHRKSKIKIGVCKQCLLNKYCAGLWKEYAQIYGTDELRPVRDRKRLETVESLLKENNN